MHTSIPAMSLPIRIEHRTNDHESPLSAEVLLERCKTLHNELEAFRVHVRDNMANVEVESSHYRSLVKSELKNLEKLHERDREHAHALEIDHSDRHVDNGETGFTKQHILSSSNLPFLECVWAAAKNTTGLQAMHKAVYFGPQLERRAHINPNRSQKQPPLTATAARKSKTYVDVVAKDGLEWIKVSLITNHRIMMDKAREGWCAQDSDSDAESKDGSDDSHDDVDDGIPIVRIAESLAEAAKLVRLKTRHPHIRLMLPKIVEGQSIEVDKILLRFRALGISVECGTSALQPVSFTHVKAGMATNPLDMFSETINIDCTILLALVSDFSHLEVHDEPWFHRALRRQIELEKKENLLPNVLYPALKGHNMVCTSEAAKRMREIVSTIGTSDEKARTALLMDDDDITAEVRREKLDGLSRFDVPGDLHLPIREVSTDEQPDDSLPAVAKDVEAELSSINQSVFLLGWKRNMTTITSNRTVVKQIENILDAKAESEHDWPPIWLCPTARSLVGKEKDRGR